MRSGCQGIPKGQPRPRASTRGKFVRMYDPGTADDWRRRIAVEMRLFIPPIPHAGPLAVGMLFEMPRPKGLLRKSSPECRLPHMATPDVDNLAKAVLDEMKQQGFMRDDAVVSFLVVDKAYATKSGTPGMLLAVVVGS